MGGVLEQAGDGWQLRFHRRIAHPREKVWRALTEPEHLAAWFPTTIEFPDGDLTPGTKLRFSFRTDKAPPFDGELLAYAPPELLEFRWGTDVLRFELRADGGGTELTLLDLLDEKGKAARDAAGWHVCLDRLAAHLDGAGEPADWTDVHPDYVARFGPDAATIGPPEAAV
jgi:uncharacterized protein YndB with AHSA1/START domain